MNNHEPLRQRLLLHLKEHGWVLDESFDSQMGGVFRRRGKLAQVVLRVARQARGPELVALLADAHLVARAQAQREDAIPVAVVGAPRFSYRMLERLKAYAEEQLAGAAWGVVDAEAPVRVFGLGRDPKLPPEIVHQVRENRKRWAASARGRAFTDLGLWMFKCLLAPQIPSEWLSAPREQIRNQSHLAEVAGVSVASAHRWVSYMEYAGFLVMGDRGFRLARIPELLQSWAAFLAASHAEEVAARFLLPGSDPRQALARAAGSSDDRSGCLGLFSACQALGLGVVSGAPQHLYLDDLSKDRLHAHGLIAVSAAEAAQVVVRRSAFPQSVFRGAVNAEGALCADVVQCWLDLRHHPVRGSEQASAIARRLGWQE